MSKQYAFVIDLKRCIGCDTCSVACKMENGVPLGQFRLNVLDSQNHKQVEKPTGEYPNLEMYWVPTMCHHCENAPCVKVCPTRALYTEEATGLVKLDTSKCIGCQSCGMACPYNAISYDSERGIADKCTLCDHRLAENKEPMCKVVCPTRAIHFGDLNDSASTVSQLVAEKPTRVLNESSGAQPRIYYLAPH